MAKPELGTKRTCPETGRNFYDLNKDPVVSPYTEKEYPLTFFEVEVEQKKSKAEAVKTADTSDKKTDIDEEDIIIDDDDDDDDDGGPEIISLEDADEADDDDDDDDVDLDDVDAIVDLPNVDLDDDDDDDIKPDDDTFLEEEDDDTDLSDVIGTKDSTGKDEV